MTKTLLKRVLIMAGGTGGHIFPGLAVAAYLAKQGVRVEWLGTANSMEARLVPEHDIPFHTISIQGVRGKGKLSLLLAPFRTLKAVYQACRIIHSVKPQVVLGMGGFVSGPGGVAAWLLRKPLVIHEQNATAGVTNVILSRFAERVLEGFPDVFKDRQHVVVVGNPVREVIANMSQPNLDQDRAAPLKLLVFGGSLGAKVFNDLLPEVLQKLPEASRPCVWHQTGKRTHEETENRYKSMGLKVKVTPFIEDMAAAYEWADIVLCRAGALTVAELCAAGRGAIFVPYPYAVDDHQTSNARFMVEQNAAICVQQSDLTQEKLTAILSQLMTDPAQCQKMASAAYSLRRAGVSAEIGTILQDVLESKPLAASV